MSDPRKTHFGFDEVSWSEKQGRVNHVFSSVAGRYDLMNDLMSAGLHRFWKDEAVRMLAPQEGETILDMAGGTGDIASRILKKIRNGRVILSDINHNMLQEGIKRFDRKGMVNLSYTLANAESLPFASSSMDGVIIGFGLRNVRDQDAALREFYRILKPQGRLVILEFSEVARPLKKPYDFYSFHVLPKLGEIVAKDYKSYQYLAESIRKHPNQEALKIKLLHVGFNEVYYRNMLHGVVALHFSWKK